MDHAALRKAHYKRQEIRCEHCGAVKWKTPHKLTRVHVKGLVQCAAAVQRLNRPVNRDEMDLDRNANGNFAALRWWGLIEQPKPNYWNVTELGWRFLRHEAWVPAHVWTIDGELVGQDPERVSIRSVVSEETWQKIEYLAKRVPVIEPGALVA